MWLPTPIYESLPYAYVVIGILLISGAAYIGFETGETSVYLGAGAASVLAGVLVYVRRYTARANKQDRGAATPATEH